MKYLVLQKCKINAYTRKSVNESVTMEQIDEKSFIVTKGATEISIGRNKLNSVTYNISEWDNILNRFILQGFVPIDNKKRKEKEIVKKTDFYIPDKTFEPILSRFVQLNDEYFEEEYSSKIKLMNPKNLKKAQDILIYLMSNSDLSIKEFNDNLLEMWTIIPRRQNNLYGKIAHDKKDYQNILTEEQTKLDILANALKSKKDIVETTDFLKSNGINEHHVEDKAEIEFIKDLMTDKKDLYSQAWNVVNDKKENDMLNFLSNNNLDESAISYLWHGTLESNIWSIIKNGLYLNPELIKSDVRICGKAFGYGLYFAPYIYKSMAYTQSCFGDGRHANNKSYILLFKVATGNPYYIYKEGGKRPNTWSDFHKDHPDKHCCWAESGQGDFRLRWDEVIVYQECQASLAYVVELNSAS